MSGGGLDSRAFALAVGLLVLVSGLRASAAPSESNSEHQSTIQSTIEALRATSRKEREAIHNYIYAVERRRCQAPLRSLRISCLLEAGRRNCQKRRGAERKQCRIVSDVVVTNRFSEPVFVSRAVRYRIMKQSWNFRDELSAELRRRYARLVTDLYLKTAVSADGPPSELAGAIDGYCREIAGQRLRLSWSHCVAAVVWFIGTNAAEKVDTP